tara:strand:+ start:2014 stop:3138 length:1125 start_codon:yes stop_codon:yes gene_type:complete
MDASFAFCVFVLMLWTVLSKCWSVSFSETSHIDTAIRILQDNNHGQIKCVLSDLLHQSTHVTNALQSHLKTSALRTLLYTKTTEDEKTFALCAPLSAKPDEHPPSPAELQIDDIATFLVTISEGRLCKGDANLHALKWIDTRERDMRATALRQWEAHRRDEQCTRKLRIQLQIAAQEEAHRHAQLVAQQEKLNKERISTWWAIWMSLAQIQLVAMVAVITLSLIKSPFEVDPCVSSSSVYEWFFPNINVMLCEASRTMSIATRVLIAVVLVIGHATVCAISPGAQKHVTALLLLVGIYYSRDNIRTMIPRIPLVLLALIPPVIYYHFVTKRCASSFHFVTHTMHTVVAPFVFVMLALECGTWIGLQQSMFSIIF